MKSKFSDVKNSIAAWYGRLGGNVRVIILGGFAIVILLCLAPTVFSGWAINYSGIILNRFNAVDDKIGDLSSASISKMIKVRRNEKDFLLSYRDFGFNEARARYITTSLEVIAAIKENMRDIRILTNDSEIIDLSNKIDRAISEYQKGLLAFVELYGFLGNENTGLEGKLNSVAHDIETILKQVNNNRLMVDLLSMRMSEKDYLINDLDMHVGKLLKAAEQFKTDIETKVTMPDHKKKLMLMVDTYTAMFRQYVQFDEQIDETRQAYFKSLQNVEPMLEKLHYISADNKQKTRDGIKRVEGMIKTTMVSSFFFVIFLSSAMALFVLKRIKEAEERLKISEIKYRLLFETSPDSIIITDMERNIIMINLRTHTLLSQDHPEELIDKSIDNIIVREDRQEVEQLFKVTTEVGSREITEFRMIKSDGGPVYVEGTSSFIFGVQGKPEAIILVVRDITDRRRAEEALKESERLLREAQIIAGLGSYILDIPAGVWTSSAMFDKLFGIDKAYERSVEGWAALSHPVDRTIMVDYLRNEVIGQGLAFDKEYRIVRHDDKAERWVHESGKLELDTLGRPLKLHGTILDITDRKKLEEQLLQSQKLEAIGTLAGGIAHDFNNLLQGVFGYISIAKRNATNEDKNIAALEQAEKALHLSISLTSQLMTFSKGGKPVKKKISLKPVLENSVRFALSGSRVYCQMNIDPDLRLVDADEGQIGQVIQNIVLNADQAMPKGGTIVITAKNVTAPGSGIPQVPDQGRYVEVSVRDNGTGISEEYQSKIFDPYFTTKEKGSGLGLATCYSIIKNHDGVINVSSKVGSGTTFYVYIPAIEAEIDSAQVVEFFPFTGKLRILLMDDDAMIREIAGEMMKSLGHEVEFAEHGEEAIRKYDTALKSGNPYNAVILDLTIRGGMGGRETIERLLSINPGIKAIVSSGYSDDDVVSDYHNYGFSARLTKPYNLEELRDTLNKMMCN